MSLILVAVLALILVKTNQSLHPTPIPAGTPPEVVINQVNQGG